MSYKSLILVYLILFLRTHRSLADSVSDCRNSIFGCCPDGITAAEGENKENCHQKFHLVTSDECHDSEFGCCSDNFTPAKGPNQEGCSDQSCQESLFGCCSDLITPAKTEDHSDCPKSGHSPLIRNYSLKSCSLSEFECCPDGLTPANGPNFKDCSEDGSVVSIKNFKVDKNICVLPQPEMNCFNYSLKWRYDMNEGRCVQFWYGGCDGNENLFNTNIDCEARCVTPNGTDICELPLINPTKVPDTETCNQNVTRYYYDINTSTCKSFIYTGCYGNANNFENIDECERSCQVPLLFEKCSFIPDKGPCRGDHERWYYDSKIGQCKTFSYGGCMINKNNHLTENDCFNSCVKPKQKNVCLLPKIVGNCDEKISSWYYDFIDGKCKEMSYSGCNGNLNRFETQEACEYTCQGLIDYPKPKITSDICNAPKVSGKCHLSLQRWYFNSTTEMCHQFSYTGCDSSPNNFESETDCRSTCNAKKIDPCELPMDVGSCDNYKIYWYYNNIDKECSRFYYGGCEGNQNKFETKEMCEMDCKMSPEEKAELLKLPKQCLEPMDYGSDCDELSPKWYFDTQLKQCYPFEYSGCGPEFSNRFNSNEECKKTCSLTSNVSDNHLEEIKTTTVSITPVIQQDVCVLPMVEGNCTQTITKWYYDSKLKYCNQFNFTGCNGNENRFENRKQCAEICEIPKKREICYSSRVQGPCDQIQLRWYYDYETQSCQQFQYGGCLGNDNNFNSLFECKNFCWEYLSEESRKDDYQTTTSVPSVYTTTQYLTNSIYDVCSMDKSEGNCEEQIERWYHDPRTKECEKFIYTGCDGNENIFESKEKCLSKCSSGFLINTYLEDENVCENSVNISPQCIDEMTGEILHSKLNNDALRSVWFYDIENRMCRSVLSECLDENNQNRFRTDQECKSQCLPNINEKQNEDDCLLPFDTGNKCSQQFWRWYYDTNTSQCQLFSYSGCHGNNNNFPTRKSCMWLCASVGNSCPSLSECDLNCPYGRAMSKNNCELCECIDPCDDHYCDLDHQCVVVDSKPLCRPKKKPGMCPQPSFSKDLNCENNCRTDADCDSDLKCCVNGCSSLQCLKPNFDKDVVIEEFKISAVLNEGETLELPCKASGYPIPTITWFKRTEEISFDSERIFLSKDNSLIIRNISERDEAVYSCRASNSKGQAVLKESSVTVNIDAEILSESYEKYVLIGNDAILNCNVTGRPYPKINWYLNGSDVSIKPDPFKYTIYPNMILIKRFNRLDIGEYKCKIDKKTKKKSEIIVSLKEAVPGEIKFGFSQVNGNENSTVLLTCEVVGEPRPTVSWYTPNFGQILQNSEKYEILNGTNLKINSLKLTDSGIYRCYAFNQFSNGFMRQKYGKVVLNVLSPPVILNSAEFKEKNVSDSVLFNCVVKGIPKPGLNWYQDDKLIVLNSTLDPKYSLKFKFMSNGSLSIENLVVNDSGNYYCQTSSLDRYQTAILNHTLKVIPSKLEITQKYSINAVETESIKLNCQIGDLTEKFDSIIWTLNNEKLEPDSPNLIINQDSNLLVIKEAKLTDTGLYTCTAQSNSSIYSTKINLNINKKQIKTTQIESKTKLIKASVNQSISLDCAWWFTNSENLFDSSLEYTIEWKLNSTKIDVENNSKKFEFLDNFKTLLQVKNIQLTEAHDIYSCSLKMFDNSERQSVFRLSVGMVPYIKNSNSNYNQISKWFYKFDSVILECPLVGYPEPKITWLQDLNELNSQLRQFKIDGNSLTIFQLDDLQQGVYSCNATNDFGSNKIDFSIGIARPIRVKDVTEKSLKVNKNDMVHMKCEYSSGSPEPNISWFFNDTKIDTLNQKYSIESNKLLIKKASENDNGVFKCILSNGFFEDKSLLFNLKVQERVVIRFYPENPVFLVGKEGRITCVIDNGAVSSELIWLKNDAPLKIGQKYQTDKNDLIIKNVKTSDSGKYSCSVNYNGDEKVTKSVDVKVIDKSIKIECEDKSSYNNCKLVVSRGLCGKFAKYCCKTCKQAGFTVKQN